VSRPSLLEALRERVLLGDGAMGTEIQRAGLESGGCGEAWNLDHPDRVLRVQRRYVEAGSEVLLSHTFGACRIMLNRHGEGERTAEINRAAVAIAREALGERGYVLGDIGPFGGLMEPYGDVAPAEVERAFKEQARALVEAGADGIIVETQTAFEELELAIDAAKDAGAAAVIGSIAFDKMVEEDDVRTMMGVSPSRPPSSWWSTAATSPRSTAAPSSTWTMAARIVARYRAACGPAGDGAAERRPAGAREHAGPLQGDARGDGRGLPGLLAAGPRIVGGCCGSTPDHIRLFRRILDERQREARLRMDGVA
jgi:5-methyltetrahydrofolate--homocysteine methyltransferase